MVDTPTQSSEHSNPPSSKPNWTIRPYTGVPDKLVDVANIPKVQDWVEKALDQGLISPVGECYCWNREWRVHVRRGDGTGTLVNPRRAIFAMAIMGNVLPSQHEVVMSCATPKCVRPSHMSLANVPGSSALRLQVQSYYMVGLKRETAERFATLRNATQHSLNPKTEELEKRLHLSPREIWPAIVFEHYNSIIGPLRLEGPRTTEKDVIHRCWVPSEPTKAQTLTVKVVRKRKSQQFGSWVRSLLGLPLGSAKYTASKCPDTRYCWNPYHYKLKERRCD